jgi:hypothetical protein
MKAISCPFEADVLAAAAASRWPDGVDAELREHALDCEICAEVAAVAAAIGAESVSMRDTVSVPDSGRVWWIAQLRARREAARLACRPITAAQVIAFACAMGLAGACFGATSTWFQSTLHTCFSSLRALDLKSLVSTAVAAEHGLVAFAVAAFLFLIPAAVYLAIRRE